MNAVLSESKLNTEAANKTLMEQNQYQYGQYVYTSIISMDFKLIVTLASFSWKKNAGKE